MTTMRDIWIAGLKEELRQAKEHLRRWRQLGKQCHKEDTSQWKATEDRRKADVTGLKLLIKLAEGK
jgi:hypothetical protein